MFGISSKTKVIAYLHTHWDREWYREFEVFRLRLIRVFDNVLDMLESDKIPSFYFDGQVAALLDYLEIRPEKEENIRDLIHRKKLFVGPFYCLADEFLTDEVCFRKNLDAGLKIAKDLGCRDFIGYFADTFGHSKNIPLILKDFGIDKAVVWRGVPEDLPSEFIFNGINTVNLVRGYFMDIFSSNKTIEEKAEFLKNNLDKIAQKSSKTLLLPIGADHLGVPEDIAQQITDVNNLLENYEIELGSIFDYFKKVRFKKKYNEELRDNSQTFILPGVYSARVKLKQLNNECSYKLCLADKLQNHFGNKYKNIIEYAYGLLLQNLAHDSICGCSTDEVHRECIVRYNKVLQIADTIIEEIRLNQPQNSCISFQNSDKYKLIEVKRTEAEKGTQIIAVQKGFCTELLHDTSKIPVTEDYNTIYTLLKEYNPTEQDSDVFVINNEISNSNIRLEVRDGKINLYYEDKCLKNFIEFVRYKDLGDTYSYAPDVNDMGEIAEVKSAKVLMRGKLRCSMKIETSFFSVIVSLDKLSKLLRFKIEWTNFMVNKLWQVRFNLENSITKTYSDDMGLIIKREFNPEYDLRKNLPDSKGKEAKTNTAPMCRFVWANGLGVITKGLNEYEVYKNTLSVTILRSTGIISNPVNPARTTPAGPPIQVPDAQQCGANKAEFALGFFNYDDWENYVEEIYPQTIIF